MEQRHPPKKPESTRLKQREIPVETVVGGRYKIQRLLGQGGFGRSYLASDIQRFDELCVLKEFVPVNESKQILQKAVDLFKQEAKTLYQIAHPQIPRFLAGFTQSQRLFIVQEYVNGVTYAQLLQQRKQQGQLFSEAEIILWLRDLLPVLDYLHSLNLIHRDIAPDNIMLSRDRGLPVLIDFGLVKDSLSWSVDSATTGSIQQTSRLGKSGYSPPEQLGMGHCYPCSDLYALGVTAIVLLTGKHPNKLIDPNTLQWTWQSLITLNTPLGEILDRLIEPKPRDRFQSAKEVLDAMQQLPFSYQRSHPVPTAKPVSVAQTLRQSEQLQAKQLADSIDLPTPSSSPSSLIPNSAFMELCRQELTRCVGPIARFLIDDTLNHYPDVTPQGFIEVLTSQISNPKQARDFRSRIQIPSGPTSEGQPASGSDSQVSPPEEPQVTSQNSFSEPSNDLNPTFLDCCQQELTHCIGPIAKLLIKQVLANNPDLDRITLAEALATQIPSLQLAAEFRQRLKNFKT
ncbi:MAG: serine/threonine-protein kinase [Kovacikia sp.]